MSKVYFSHYGEVYSLSKQDAEKLANDALKNNSWNLEKYESTKMLKGKQSVREESGFKYNGSWKIVHHCLDWEKTDWEYFLESEFGYKFK